MSFDCHLHVAVTPYSSKFIHDGVKAVEKFDPNNLIRLPWPRTFHGKGRVPEGGLGGQIVAEQMHVVWHGDSLICPISEQAKPVADRPPKHETEIHYHGSFLAQIDGQVAYVPDLANTTHYLIMVESPVAEIHAIRFGPQHTALIDPFIKHSMPIPLRGELQFIVWHRSVNAVVQLAPDPAGIQPVVINLCKVNRIEPITIRKVCLPPELAAKKPHKLPHLPHSFAKEVVRLTDVSETTFAPFGRLINDFTMHNEEPGEACWPGVEAAYREGMAGTLCQEFMVTWKMQQIEPEHGVGKLELEFEGITGSFAGEKGHPGVDYSSDLGIYRANLLMARPDGTFYIQPSHTTDSFVMAFALPDTQTGEPIDRTLQAFTFREGQALRLEPGVWHSVPIPLVGSGPVVFTEVIAATNANLVINVLEECGHPIQFVQAI
uniref:Ureidoglycolate hydrolase n=2 Tax=Meloidogyne TaxID=189290 RepID=A0A914LWN1_MELIC